MHDDFRFTHWDFEQEEEGPDTTVEMPLGMESTESEIHIPEELPILPVRDIVVFPRTIAPLSRRETTLRAIH